MLVSCSSDGHLEIVLNDSQARKLSTRERDDLICGSGVSKTAHDLSIVGHYTMEQVTSSCVDKETVSEGYYANTSSGYKHGCLH